MMLGVVWRWWGGEDNNPKPLPPFVGKER